MMKEDVTWREYGNRSGPDFTMEVGVMTRFVLFVMAFPST